MQALKSLVCFILTTIYLLEAAVGWCPQGWYSWRDSCYIPLANSLSWEAASESCRDRGGLLMVQNSREEHEFIIKLRDRSFDEHQRRDLWVGCKIILIDQNLKCLGNTNGRDIFINYWNPPEPTIDNGVGKNCIRKGGYANAHLFVDDCNKSLFVICEMPIVPVYCLSLGDDGRVAPQCLLGHEIKNLTVKGISECGQACWAEPRCRSFNLWLEGSAKICHLNNATHLEVSTDDFIEQPGGKCVYFDL